MVSAAKFALLGVAAVASVADGGEARMWDELRISSVEPHKVSKPPLAPVEFSGFGSYFSTFGWSMDALRLQGAELISSASFRFEPLKNPYEWSAVLLGLEEDAPKMYVGRSCHCDLSGLSAYAKDDTAWLRLHLERCFGCPSTAARAAIVMPMMPSDGGDSNLFAFMCAVNPEATVCLPKLGTTSTTVTTTTKTTTSVTGTTTTVSTTTTPKPSTDSAQCQLLEVTMRRTGPNLGECIGTGETVTKDTGEESNCQALCVESYLSEHATYVTVHELNANLDKINAGPKICKGYAFNAHTMKCNLYLGGTAKADPAATDDHWRCFSEMSASSFFWKRDTSNPACDPTTTTITTTSTTMTATTTTGTTTTITVTTTTTSTTRRIETLSLLSVLGDVKVDRGGEADDDAEDMSHVAEATVLQLQSPCYSDVDYYMFGSPLPVKSSQWDHLMRLLTDSLDLGAWTNTAKWCCASITVDRVVIDTGSAQHSSFTWVMGLWTRVVEETASNSAWTRAVTLSILAILAVAFFGMAFSVLLKENWFGDSGCNSCYIMLGVVGAIVSALAFCLVFAAALGLCWSASGQSHKEVYNEVAQKLSSMCLPAATVVLGASIVYWYWPLREPEPREDFVEARKLTLKYDRLASTPFDVQVR